MKGSLFLAMVKTKDFVDLLKICGQEEDLCKGSRLHAEVLRRHLLKHSHIASGLITMYFKCGTDVKALEVFDQLPVRDVVVWSTLISGYVQHNRGDEALEYYKYMQFQGISPNEFTFASVLRACGSIGAVDKGKQVHREIVKMGLLEKSTVLGNALVNMYAKCGDLIKAEQVLCDLPSQDPVSWNTLIAGYLMKGHSEKALSYFEQMQQQGFAPNVVTFASVLQACGHIGVEKGRRVHYEILNQGLLVNNVVLGSALVDMYIKCNMVARAKQVLDELPVRDVVCWSALITGYVQQGQFEEALVCYDQMLSEGLFPNEVTFACILKACGSLGAVEKGKLIHDEIASKCLLDKNVVLGTAVVDMYAKCGAVGRAKQAFDKLPIRNAVSWCALIAGYTQWEQGEEALSCFEKMQSEGFSPDPVTFISITKVCGKTCALDKGKQIHDEIVNMGFQGKDLVLDTALLDMYAKCGMLAQAQQVLEKQPVRNVVSWSALISGYADHGQFEAALNCLEQMQCEYISPNEVTFICILKACGRNGALDKGKKFHGEIIKQGLLGQDVTLGNAIVDMYCKCGSLMEAQQVFDKLPVRNTVCWNALITGYAKQVQGHEALDCFGKMQYEGLFPDAVTFTSMLNACSRSGLDKEGHSILSDMNTQYGIIPSMEHYTSFINCLGCKGDFEKLLEVIKKMPLGYSSVWTALLGACRRWNNVKIGTWAFERALQVHYCDAVAYGCRANIFSAAGMHVGEIQG